MLLHVNEWALDMSPEDNLVVINVVVELHPIYPVFSVWLLHTISKFIVLFIGLHSLIIKQHNFKNNSCVFYNSLPGRKSVNFELGFYVTICILFARKN